MKKITVTMSYNPLPEILESFNITVENTYNEKDNIEKVSNELFNDCMKALDIFSEISNKIK